MRVRGNAVGNQVVPWMGDHASFKIDGRAVDVDDEHLGVRRPTGDHEFPIRRDVRGFDGIRVRCRLGEHDDPPKISIPRLELRAEKVVASRQREITRRPET